MSMPSRTTAAMRNAVFRQLQALARPNQRASQLLPKAAGTSAAAALAQRPPVLPYQLQSSSLSMSAAIQTTGQHPTPSTISTFNPNPRVSSTTLLDESSQVEILWDDGHASHHHYIWLRVNCRSFVHESGQRTVFPGDVDPQLRPVEVSASDSVVKVIWSDGHVSEYGMDWLRAHDNSPSALQELFHGSTTTPLCAWDEIPKVDGRAYMENDESLYEALLNVNRSGMALLDNVGTRERSVLDLARRVSPISHKTLYGELFDVVTQVNPRNLAYTDERLRLHMDQVYYESPPGLQFLHCLEFGENIKNGATTFIDVFAAAEHFRQQFPDKFEVLSRVPATFEKVRAAAPNLANIDRNAAASTAAHMKYQKPIFQLDVNGAIVVVNWAPMFEGVLMCAAQDVAPYYAAYREFQHFIEEGEYAQKHTVRKRLQPGECVIFNNRTMLHGREVIAPSGEKYHRWLQGCYVNIDDASSRLCSLRTALGSPSSSDHDGTCAPDNMRRVGNGSLPLVP